MMHHIHSHPKIMLGKPVIKGTRITVKSIKTKIANGFTINDLLEMYPHISKENIQACIAYQI